MLLHSAITSPHGVTLVHRIKTQVIMKENLTCGVQMQNANYYYYN